MFGNLCTWLDHRTGYKRLLEVLLLEHIPGGAKWRYVWGSCLAFVFGIQVLTGLLLMTSYSPGDSTAWGSVYFIQYEMEFGWFIRGLHHFGSQGMVVLLALHMLQVVIGGAHLPPREVNWWLGLSLMGAILGLSLTGYLLPWDQKGYWATQVATSIAGNLPGMGSFIKRVAVGGPEYGNHTLTRFYALHVGVLPAAVVVMLVMHIAVFRRHGVTAPKHAEGEAMFWPDQAFKDLVGCLAVFGVLLYLVIFGGFGNAQPLRPAEPGVERSFYDEMAYAGKDGRGANLDAPADPEAQYPARPEWYFLFLFQLLKYFEGDQILIGTVIIPNGVGVLLFLLPLFGYGRMRPLGHILGVLVVVAVLTGASSLTCLALGDDTPDPLTRKLYEQLALLVIPAVSGVLLLQLAILALLPQGAFRKVIFALGTLVLGVLILSVGTTLYAAITDQLTDILPKEVRAELAKKVDEKADHPSEATLKARAFQDHVKQAEKSAQRAVEIAHAGIPEGGAALLLRRDPMTVGKKLFVQNCGSCHSFKDVTTGDSYKASDLTNYGSKEWIRSMLEHAEDPRFFGRTDLKGMRTWSSEHRDYRKSLEEELAKKDLAGNSAAEAKKTLTNYDAWVDRVADWLATHPTGEPKEKAKTQEEKKFAEGYAAFFDDKQDGRCSKCHKFADKGGNKGPDLTGYGSADWIRLMIVAPSHRMRFGDKNKMPAFRNDQGPGSEILLQELVREREDAKVPDQKYSPLSDVNRELIIRFLQGDDRVVFFGRPIAGPAISGVSAKE